MYVEKRRTADFHVWGECYIMKKWMVVLGIAALAGAALICAIFFLQAPHKPGVMTSGFPAFPSGIVNKPGVAPFGS